MRNLLLPRKNTMQNLSRFQIQNIHAHVTPEADVRDPVPAVDGVGKDAALAYIFELPDHLLFLGIEDRKHSLAAQEEEPSVQADETVVSRRSNSDSPDQISGSRVEHQQAAIRAE